MIASVRALSICLAFQHHGPRRPLVTMMKAPVELTSEQLAKREQRARQREAQQSPAGRAAAAAKAEQEAVAKRESRRLRDIQDAETLREWAITDAVSGDTCELVDIGANLVKLKGDGLLEQQLRRCQLTGVSRVLVTGTSLAASRRALELVRQVRQAEGTPQAAGVSSSARLEYTHMTPSRATRARWWHFVRC